MNNGEIERFKNWLNSNGAVVLPTTNEYELVRFRANDKGIGIIYTGKRGLSFVGHAEPAYERFKAGRGWKPIPQKRKQLRALKSRLATRDGKRCFADLKRMTFDELTIEHLLSFSHGGSDNENNLCLLCHEHNDMLGNMPVVKKLEKIMEIRSQQSE